MNKIKERITSSPTETKKWAKALAKATAPPKVLALYGGLGAGKTTFIQGLAKGLGIRGRVLSPTFIFIRPYKLSKGYKFYHVDLYRMISEKDAKSIGLTEILQDKNAIVAVEWPEKIENLLPKGTVKIKLEALSETKRQISVVSPT